MTGAGVSMEELLSASSVIGISAIFSGTFPAGVEEMAWPILTGAAGSPEETISIRPSAISALRPLGNQSHSGGTTLGTSSWEGAEFFFAFRDFFPAGFFSSLFPGVFSVTLGSTAAEAGGFTLTSFLGAGSTGFFSWGFFPGTLSEAWGFTGTFTFGGSTGFSETFWGSAGGSRGGATTTGTGSGSAEIGAAGGTRTASEACSLGAAP